MNRIVASVAVSSFLVFAGASATLAVGMDGEDAAEPRAVPLPSKGTCRAGIHAGAAAAKATTVAPKAILACVAPSLAFIETPAGTGSGILVGGGLIVTNAHVVDPFATVTVVFAGGERHEEVVVKGVDLMSDLAVLGPVATKRPALAIGEARGLEKGDDVFLVGYPGEVDEEPEPTISRGILSRTRHAREFGLTFLQTDAAIGGGQSGGALVDGAGRIVGMSGFSFADEFALALSGADTSRSLARIVAGDAPPYRAFPESPDSSSGSFHLDDTDDVQLLTVRTGGEAQRVRLTLPAGANPAVLVSDLDAEDVYFRNQAALEARAEQSGEEGGTIPEDDEKADPAVAPGVFEFEVPKDTYGIIMVGTRRPGGAEMNWSSSVPLGHYEDRDDGVAIEVGRSVSGEIDAMESAGDTYVLQLEEGDVVEIFAGSATGDVAYLVREPAQRLRDAELVDDSEVGLWGTDAKEEYRASTSGPHRITVVSSDGLATAYVLKVAKT